MYYSEAYAFGEISFFDMYLKSKLTKCIYFSASMVHGKEHIRGNYCVAIYKMFLTKVKLCTEAHVVSIN